MRSFFMRLHSSCYKYIGGLMLFFLFQQKIIAQPITGIWKGKMGNSRVELKLIRKGDSLIGTSYYYESTTSYRRYAVKGYFDDRNNDVIWWDDVLIEATGPRRLLGNGPQQNAQLAVADFNCPGEGIMKLDGTSSRKNDDTKDRKELHLLKGEEAPVFPDEWDFLIDNYAFGVSHPEVVDSIEQLATTPVLPTNQSLVNTSKQQPEKIDPSAVVVPFVPAAAQTNQARFTNRTKILQNVITVKGDSLELRFYDNAEIDGDSIAVFLNGKLLKEHILLAEQAYIMKIAITDLQADNELVMVAENLGTIPPNTSLLVAIVEDKRYEAHLQSTEGSSALVRLLKP